MRRAAPLLVAVVATLWASSAHATIVISSDRGGLISDYAARFLSARISGDQVVIDGACLSACTLVVGTEVCAHAQGGAGLSFRLAADDGRQAGEQLGR
jgi:hypothetical protein